MYGENVKIVTDHKLLITMFGEHKQILGNINIFQGAYLYGYRGGQLRLVATTTLYNTNMEEIFQKLVV